MALWDILGILSYSISAIVIIIVLALLGKLIFKKSFFSALFAILKWTFVIGTFPIWGIFWVLWKLTGHGKAKIGSLIGNVRKKGAEVFSILEKLRNQSKEDTRNEDEVYSRVEDEEKKIEDAVKVVQDPQTAENVKVDAIKDLLNSEQELFQADEKSLKEELDRLEKEGTEFKEIFEDLKDQVKSDGQIEKMALAEMRQLSKDNGSLSGATSLRENIQKHEMVLTEFNAMVQQFQQIEIDLEKVTKDRMDLTDSGLEITKEMGDLLKDGSLSVENLPKLMEKIQELKANRDQARQLGDQVKEIQSHRSPLFDNLAQKGADTINLLNEIHNSFTQLKAEALQAQEKSHHKEDTETLGDDKAA
jgi:hypothetical protein